MMFFTIVFYGSITWESLIGILISTSKVKRKQKFKQTTEDNGYMHKVAIKI
jgi:hypothetical protein